jgi:hypothetical protein
MYDIHDDDDDDDDNDDDVGIYIEARQHAAIKYIRARRECYRREAMEPRRKTQHIILLLFTILVIVKNILLFFLLLLLLLPHLPVSGVHVS